MSSAEIRALYVTFCTQSSVYCKVPTPQHKSSLSSQDFWAPDRRFRFTYREINRDITKKPIFYYEHLGGCSTSRGYFRLVLGNCRGSWELVCTSIEAKGSTLQIKPQAVWIYVSRVTLFVQIAFKCPKSLQFSACVFCSAEMEGRDDTKCFATLSFSVQSLLLPPSKGQATAIKGVGWVSGHRSTKASAVKYSIKDELSALLCCKMRGAPHPPVMSSQLTPCSVVLCP